MFARVYGLLSDGDTWLKNVIKTYYAVGRVYCCKILSVDRHFDGSSYQVITRPN